MDNKIYLDKLKSIYDSLKYFDYENNHLILRLEKEFRIPFVYTNLSDIKNTNLFLLHPKEIFQILYMLELLYKHDLTENEISFIKSYIDKYLLINDNAKNNNNEDLNRLWSLELPINLAYDPVFESTPASLIIAEEINKHTETQESSRGNNQILKLTKEGNSNFEMYLVENNFENFTNAGFTTLFLIIGAIVSACIYLAYFITHTG